MFNVLNLYHQTSDKKLLWNEWKRKRYLTVHCPNQPGLRIRIQKKLKLGLMQKCNSSSTHRMIGKTFTQMLVQKMQETKVTLVTSMSHWKRNDLRIGSRFSPVIGLQKQMNRRWLWWDFVREDNSPEASNERLKCNAVTSFTGKLKAVKNGWRNRMNRPALITVVWH